MSRLFVLFIAEQGNKTNSFALASNIVRRFSEIRGSAIAQEKMTGFGVEGKILVLLRKS